MKNKNYFSRNVGLICLMIAVYETREYLQCVVRVHESMDTEIDNSKPSANWVKVERCNPDGIENGNMMPPFILKKHWSFNYNKLYKIAYKLCTNLYMLHTSEGKSRASFSKQWREYHQARQF